VLPIDQVPEHLRLNNMTLWAGKKDASGALPA
jgi:hypothetical protein